MAENKLNQGDISAIAKAANCHHKTVELILSGKRGKRKTDFQLAILKAVKLREKQNEKLIKFCQSISVEKVTPKNITK